MPVGGLLNSWMKRRCAGREMVALSTVELIMLVTLMVAIVALKK